MENLGDSEALFKRSDHFRTKAKELVQRGVVPREHGWGGWLGQYQKALTDAAENVGLQQTVRKEDPARQRTLDR